jgi:hypothetical protein
MADAPDQVGVPKTVQHKVGASAQADFAALWPHVQAEAESRQHEAATKLRSRGRAEAEALRGILADQRRAIEQALADKQVPLSFTPGERAQLEADRRHMANRLERIGGESQTEPARIERRYEIALKRLESVGVVYLYPEV